MRWCDRTISVAMATFNGAAFIREQVESLARQTLLPTELVVCDDRSTDDTVAILEAMRPSLPFRLTVCVNEQRLFPHGNFAKALSLTSGELVFLCDQDDVWMESKIAAFAQAMEQGGYHAAIGNLILCDRDLREQQVFFSPVQGRYADPRNYVLGCATAYTREFLEIALPLDGLESKKIWFDVWLSHLAEVLSTRTFITRPHQYWRRHDNAWSGPEMHVAQAGKTGRNWIPWGSAISQIGSIERQIEINAEIMSRLDRNKSLLRTLDVASIRQRLKAEMNALHRRRRALTAPRLFRVPSVIGAYASGAYARAGGPRSAIIDTIR
jgi:glycosyltransferase involved in cell wall biosynthesis